MAGKLVEMLSGGWDADAHHDTYRDSVLELIKAKAGGEDVTIAPAKPKADSGDALAKALEASLAALEGGGAKTSASKKSSASKSSSETKTKPKAKRTVRTIDLGEPGTWTSGRTEEDTQIVARAAADQAEVKAADEAEQRRAVGS